MDIYNPLPHLFLNNKFTHCYFFMIGKIRLQNRIKLDNLDINYIYYENHHIQPRSLEGTEEPDNMILLTATEHYILHWLLPKMCINGQHRNKLLYPLNCMTNETKIDKPAIVARLYGAVKAEISEAMSIDRKGKKQPESYREMMKIRSVGEGNQMFGKTHNADTRKEMSDLKTGENNPNYGKEFSDETKQNMSDAFKGRKNDYKKNGRTHKWFKIVYPDGTEELVTNRVEWALEHGYRAGSISHAASHGVKYNGMTITYV